MYRGAARIQRSAQCGPAFAGHVRDRAFTRRKLVRKRDHHGMQAGGNLYPRLEKTNTFGMGQAIPADESPQVVLAVERKVMLDANASARTEGQTGTEPGRLRFGRGVGLCNRRRFASACRKLADSAGDL